MEVTRTRNFIFLQLKDKTLEINVAVEFSLIKLEVYIYSREIVGFKIGESYRINQYSHTWKK